MITRFKVVLSYPQGKLPVDYRTNFIGAVSSMFEKEKYHGKGCKPYSISDLQGVICQKGNKHLTLRSVENPYFYVTSANPLFCKEFKKFDFRRKSTFNLYGCKIIDIIEEDVFLDEDSDVVRTMSPLLLRDNQGDFGPVGYKYTVKDLEIFLPLLQKNIDHKLTALGFLPSVKVELLKDIAKKVVFIHEVWNPTSLVQLRLTGPYNQREALFSCGLGSNTGIGFGALNISYNVECQNDIADDFDCYDD